MSFAIFGVLVIRIQFLLFVFAHSLESQITLLIEVLEDAQILITGPEEVLDSLREGQVDNGFEEVVDEDLPLDAIGAATDPKLCNDAVDIVVTFLPAMLQLFL